jgi:translation elongation factor EF-G
MGNTQNGALTGNRATRAVALVGPAGTGKTSLAEALLFASGAINRQGTVEAGNTVGDASPEARARGVLHCSICPAARALPPMASLRCNRPTWQWW